MTDEILHNTKRAAILKGANELIHGERQAHYGEPAENFGVIAEMWSAYLQYPVTASDVCHMMALLKIARLRNGPHEDSSVDGCGYLALGAEVA